jgi:predicted RNA-binding protein
MKIKPYLLTLKEEERSLTSKKKLIRSLSPKTNSYIKNLNQGDSRSFRKDKEKEKISHPTNVTIVTRWDIL